MLPRPRRGFATSPRSELQAPGLGNRTTTLTHRLLKLPEKALAKVPWACRSGQRPAPPVLGLISFSICRCAATFPSSRPEAEG